MITHQTYEPDYSPLQKIAIFAALTFALVLIVITGQFFYEFIRTYRTELNTAVFYGLAFLGVLFLIVATYSAFYVLAMLTLNYQTKREAIKSAQSNTDLFGATAKQIKAGAVYLSEQRTEQGIVRFKALPKHSKKQPKPVHETAAPLALPLPEIKNSILSDIEPLQRLLIVGGQNSGKTTLLKHIANQRSVTSNVLIFDSHNHAGKWNDDYRIVGHGRDYQAIETELKNLVSVMDARYKEYATGKVKERQHDLITVISDEWTTLSENINNLDSYLLPLLTESRKVGIDFIIACHSETAGSLGLKGRFDLKKNFDAVLRLKNVCGNRLINLDKMEKGLLNMRIVANLKSITRLN